MTAVFVDTFYWIAPADFTDSAHQTAFALAAEQAPSRIFTTDEVLTEYLTFFSTAPSRFRSEVAESVEGLLTSSFVRAIPQSRGSFRAGLQLYRARADKGYSLVDCISMQTMRRKEGFHALFRSF
jgi:predicted nucleic acid-binding protein